MLWSFGIGWTLLAGAEPYPERVIPSAEYPWAPVARIAAIITLEAAALYIVLRWLPVPRPGPRRALLAAVLSVTFLAFDGDFVVFDGPPWNAVNGQFTTAAAATFTVYALVLVIAARFRAGNAA
jgi:hypothetical protein